MYGYVGRTICLVKNKLEKVAIANALQHGDRTTLYQSLWAVLANFVLRMRIETAICRLPIKILTSPLA